MGRYLIRRSLFLILVLWIVSVITFLIFLKLPPGDPARRAAGRRSTPETIAAARRALGLDKPWYIQYGRFTKGLVPIPGWFLNEDFYFSWANYVPVKEEIFRRLPVSATLTLGAAIVWLRMGIPIGIISAIRRRSLADRSAMIFALFGVSAPIFWLAYLFLFLFWYKFNQWFGWGAPPSGLPPRDSLLQSILGGRFLLAWFALALAYAAFYTRMVRGNLIETMSEDYIRTARAKGLSERRVIFKHGLRAALTPVVTMFGMDVGYLLGGAVITETVFNLSGVGQYALNAIRTNDFPAVMGVTVFAAFFIVVANLIVDVAYAFLDPRVRYT
ncbi:MAG TPA: ABC transporter permease, partial [Actinomycetota bacterium]|nr:ABC transporter permease [Actinomycetota bacterium]